MGRGVFALRMFGFWGRIPAIVIAFVFLSGIIVGCIFDLRYIIVSAMAAFILFPMVFVFLYYYYGLGKNCYFNVVDHNFILKPEALVVTMYFTSVTNDNENETECDAVEIKKVVTSIDYGAIGRYKIYADSVVYPVGHPVDGFIWLPLSAFMNIEDFNNAVSSLSKKLTIIHKPCVS